LFEAGATHILVEPGPTLARAFIEQNLADRIWIIHAPGRIDSPDAPAAPPTPADWPISAEVDLDGDRLVEMLNPHGPAFFAPVPSADFPPH
jgi:riboflavin biosynthesis pyrimidine reductase